MFRFAAALPLLVVFGLCFNTTPAWAQRLPVNKMTIADVSDFVVKSDIRSVEELMRNLPEVMLQTFTLVEDSRSRQRPSQASAPRLILFLPDGRFFMAIATSHRSRAYDDVEMLEFKSDKTWKLDVVRFPVATERKTKKAEPFFREQLPRTEQCSSCHGPSERPIWGNYPVWPGVFADNAGQRLTERQARRLTEALSQSGGNARLKLLDFRGNLEWKENDRFNIPAYHDVPSPDLPNDAIISRQSESLGARIEKSKDRKILSLAYLFLQRSDFLAATSDKYQEAVARAKDKLKKSLDAAIARGGITYPGASYGDKALLLFGFDAYDDLFVSRGLHDLNPDWKVKETYIDRNFGAGGDDLNAFIHLFNTNYLVKEYPRLEGKFEATKFPYLSEYANHNAYRKGLSSWLWETTVDQRVAHLQRRRHLAGQLRFRYLFSDEMQAAIVEDLLQIVDEVLP